MFDYFKLYRLLVNKTIKGMNLAGHVQSSVFLTFLHRKRQKEVQMNAKRQPIIFPSTSPPPPKLGEGMGWGFLSLLSSDFEHALMNLGAAE
jgi:hypothetical protein